MVISTLKINDGQKVIFTAGSMALACLENLVHRSGASLQADFSVITIFVPPGVSIAAIADKKPGDALENKLRLTRQTGSSWLKKGETAILKVPGAIIQAECNFLLNRFHVNFGDIKIIYKQAFYFDHRLKQ